MAHNVLDAFCQLFNNINMHNNLKKLGINDSMGMNAMFSYQFSLRITNLFWSCVFFGKKHVKPDILTQGL